MKTPFVTKEQLEEIITRYPTPFHIYDERGIDEAKRELIYGKNQLRFLGIEK